MVVHPCSHRVSRVRRYSGYQLFASSFAYGILTLCDWPSHAIRLDNLWSWCESEPRRINPPVWPPPRSLATTSGISVDVFSSPYLDVSVQAVPLIYLFYSVYDTLKVGFPIRKSPDRSSFAAPRSLSQLITSFIGSWCQGIPLALLLAWPSRKIHFFWFL